MELILLSGMGTAALLVTGLYELVREHWLRGCRATSQTPLAITQTAACVADTVPSW